MQSSITIDCIVNISNTNLFVNSGIVLHVLEGKMLSQGGDLVKSGNAEFLFQSQQSKRFSNDHQSKPHQQ